MSPILLAARHGHELRGLKRKLITSAANKARNAGPTPAHTHMVAKKGRNDKLRTISFVAKGLGHPPGSLFGRARVFPPAARDRVRWRALFYRLFLLFKNLKNLPMSPRYGTGLF